MAIDPLAEEVLSMSQAARRLPRLRADRPVSPSTLWRWATNGLRGTRLEIIRVGGTTCTSVEALGRFFTALNGDRPRETPAGRERHDAAVERQLAERGV
jgi:hypothetical protein